jgi:diadenosine tetraphosphate (Ap4A) HIT family hydrolase
MPEFELHPRLAADTVLVAEWALSRVLLMDDARYAWLVLVPRRPASVELFDLSEADRGVLIDEIARAAKLLKTVSGATKINVASLGNLVPQLHVHVVARHPGDPAWPGPVWGHSAAMPYATAEREALVAKILDATRLLSAA